MTPGLLVAAPASGVGKTTVSLGLMRAFAGKGLTVQAFKSGPDYIDPAFHAAATGRASFNLDTWAMDAATLREISGKATDADLVIGEGAMGLFDGAATSGETGNGSAAGLAGLMGWPVLMVVDVRGQAQSVAATVKGFCSLDPSVSVAGVILNGVASPRHERLLRAGLSDLGIPILGVLPRQSGITLPERHLGLVQAVDHPNLTAILDRLARFARDHIDLEAVRSAAGGIVSMDGVTSRASRVPPGQRIALARDAAFTFIYPHLLEGWRDAGAEILPFSPLADEAPDPDADCVWLPGGYPELHAGRLSAARTFMRALRHLADRVPVYGECGGYMVLGEALIDADGNRHTMSRLLGLVTSFADRRLHLGYRLATLKTGIPGFAPGTRLRGHEFHYSTVVAQPDPALAEIRDADGGMMAETGSYRGYVSGSFFHMIGTASR